METALKQKKRAISLRSLLPSSRPLWVLALSTLARSTGNGVVVAIIVLYLTHSVDISSTHVGLALTVAAVVGMVVSIPAGHATDVLGARPAAIWSVVLQGIAVWGYVLVGGFAALVAAAPWWRSPTPRRTPRAAHSSPSPFRSRTGCARVPTSGR